MKMSSDGGRNFLSVKDPRKKRVESSHAGLAPNSAGQPDKAGKPVRLKEIIESFYGGAGTRP